MSPESVGPYRILQKLGAGGMGEVYLAEDTRLKRQVALKSLSEAWARKPDARQRLLHEARAAAAPAQRLRLRRSVVSGVRTALLRGADDTDLRRHAPFRERGQERPDRHAALRRQH